MRFLPTVALALLLAGSAYAQQSQCGHVNVLASFVLYRHNCKLAIPDRVYSMAFDGAKAVGVDMAKGEVQMEVISRAATLTTEIARLGGMEKCCASALGRMKSGGLVK